MKMYTCINHEERIANLKGIEKSDEHAIYGGGGGGGGHKSSNKRDKSVALFKMVLHRVAIPPSLGS